MKVHAHTRAHGPRRHRRFPACPPVLEVLRLLADDLEAHGLVAHAVPTQDVHGPVQRASGGLVLVEKVPPEEHKVHLVDMAQQSKKH